MMLYGLHTEKNMVLVGAAPYLYFISMQYVLTNKSFVPSIGAPKIFLCGRLTLRLYIILV